MKEFIKSGKRIRPLIKLGAAQMDRLLHKGSVELISRNRIRNGKINRESFYKIKVQDGISNLEMKLNGISNS